MHLFIPELFDTGYTRDALPNDLATHCDFLKKTETVEAGKVVTLRWTTRSSRTQKSNLLFIVKYWVTPFGTRKLRLQCHKIHDNGTLGTRNIIIERHNGRIVR